jgi:hypothetical protein
VRRAYHRLVHRADWIVTAVIQSATFAALIDPFNRILLVALPWLALPALLLPNLMRVGHDELLRISVTATLLIVSNIAEARHFELTPWCPACRHSEDGEDGGPAPDDDPLLIPDWWRELSRR